MSASLRTGLSKGERLAQDKDGDSLPPFLWEGNIKFVKSNIDFVKFVET